MLAELLPFPLLRCGISSFHVTVPFECFHAGIGMTAVPVVKIILFHVMGKQVTEAIGL
jgi:hypothetical protein